MELILFVFVCLLLLFTVAIFLGWHWQRETQCILWNISLCWNYCFPALCRFSVLFPSFNVIAASFTGCYTKHELAFGFFKGLVFIIRLILFSSTVGCRHIKDKWNHKRYAVTRWRNFYLMSVFNESLWSSWQDKLFVWVKVKTRFQFGHCLGVCHTKVYNQTKWSVPVKITFI